MYPINLLLSWRSQEVTVVLGDVAMPCVLAEIDAVHGLLIVYQDKKPYIINLRAVDMIYPGHDKQEGADDNG